ncbi:hypothetical protein SAMN04487936_11386 [Halobacillus dabanensis]|uniref:Serine aminopeptidase S33 domain-containing protein n=1 Tax=Halobacillus dabanensis TaxID=240302 RepID=A0A1I3ZBI8_HALDA|nr:alpha/beta fold hydrolase [Halobacillus dabanensis]SFK41474.1 hypothetical protein SAMN04487936_11386 [Halobacillus dabanensis]
MKKLLLILIVLLITVGCNKSDSEAEDSDRTSTKELEGYWEGEIQVPNQPLNIQIEFHNGKEWTGMIEIPAQNVRNFTLSEIKTNGNDVSFRMPLAGQSILFDGTIEGEELKGTFTQNGQSFPFSLTKGEKVKEEEEGEFLSIETATGALYGELLMPQGEKVAPVALIIPGSGPTDRDGNSQGSPGKNDSLKLLAEELAAKGIATLRYDKRGAGRNADSVVAQEEMRFDVFIDDAKQWLELLEADDRFTDIAVIGHSQGSLVGMMAAGPETTEAFISLAGAGQTIDQLLESQLKESLEGKWLEESQKILESLRDGETVTEVSQPLQSVFAPNVQPFLLSWMAYDPAEQLADLEVPTLIINGRHDLQVSAEEARRLERAKPDAEVLLFDEMNHVLKEAPETREENLATYSNPDLPLAQGLTDSIVDFLHRSGFSKQE